MSTGLKLFIKLMCLLTAIALAGPFILRAPDGQPFLQIDQFLPNISFNVPSLSDWESLPDGIGEHAGETKVYTWISEDGSPQFSNIEPEATDYEVIWIDPDTNLIQGAAAPAPSSPQAPGGKSNISKLEAPPIFTISPEKIGQLKKDAENVQSLMDARQKSLENL